MTEYNNLNGDLLDELIQINIAVNSEKAVMCNFLEVTPIEIEFNTDETDSIIPD